MAKRIESRPTDGLSYNSTEPKYWDRAGLDKEVERVFDICHGCRLCFNLCPSFPALFDAVDRNDGDVRALTGATGASCARSNVPTRRTTGMNSSSISRA
jgi:glycerol-3-phosphate dehydrogenase subunit C